MTTILTTDILDQLAVWLRIVRVKELSNLNAVVMIQRDPHTQSHRSRGRGEFADSDRS
jgi:hypothetical protein